SDKPVYHTDYIIPFKAESHQRLEAYVRIVHATQILLPITLETETTLKKSTQNSLFLMVAFAGLIMVISLYNFFVFIATRDLAYLYYVIYVSASGLYFITLHGIGFQFIWAELP